MAEDKQNKKSFLDKAASALGGRVKESLGVNKETKGFGNIMGGAFSAANMFGADSFLGETFSSDEERDRVKQFGKDQKTAGKSKASSSGGSSLFGGAAKVENAGIAAEALEPLAEDVKTLRNIAEEEFTAPPVEAKADKKEDKDPEFDQLRKKEEVKKKEVAKVVGITSAQGDTMIGLLEDITRSIGDIDTSGGGGMGAIIPGRFGKGGGGGRTTSPRVGNTPKPNTVKPTKVPTKTPSLLSKTTNAAKSVGSKAVDTAKSVGSKAVSTGSSVAKGVGGGLAKVGAKGIPILGTALAVGEGALDVYNAEQDMENLEISAEEAQIAKGEGIGTAAGTLAGAAAGAAIGSVVPVVGTIIGGIVGGALGYFAGGAAGEAIADALPVDPGEIAESNAVAEELLSDASKKIDGKAAVDKIRNDASEIETTLTEATLEESGNEKLSENDVAAIENAALVKAIQNNKSELDAIGVSTDPEAMQALNAKIENKVDAPEKRGAEITDSGIVPSKSIETIDEKRGAVIPAAGTQSKQTATMQSNPQSANTPAASVESATDIAATSNTPAAPVIIQQGGQAAPAASPDVNVLVTLPKSISPNNATGTRYLASVMS